MPIHTKVSGQWKDVKEVYVKVGGVWKKCQNVYVKKDGAWKPLLQYQLSTALPTLTNDTTKSKTIQNVAVGTIMTLGYNATNNVWDGSDYIGVSVGGATPISGAGMSGNQWRLGPGGGYYELKCTATASSVTIYIWGHGMTSASGTCTYYSDR